MPTTSVRQTGEMTTRLTPAGLSFSAKATASTRCSMSFIFTGAGITGIPCAAQIS
jgi:hypothetical protein